MRIDWRTDKNHPRARVIDLDTGKQLIYCAMADEETGEYIQYEHDGTKFIIGHDQRVLTKHGKARIKIVLLADGEPYFQPQP